MPIYEFYCPDCHMVFSFFSPRINTTKRPNCPKCRRPELERRVSLFSISRGLEDRDDADPYDKIDDSKLEKAVAVLAQEAGKINEDDPRQAAKLMRKVLHSAGLEVGGRMEEAMARMEAGEDPDQIEADLGDDLGDDFLFGPKKKWRNALLPPRVDENIYDL